MKIFIQKIKETEGAVATEYIILALLIVVVLAVFFMPALNEVMEDAFNGISDKISDMISYVG